MANEILKFATNVTGSNVLTQASYAAANPSPRTVGHVPGVASNQLENKVLMQVSAVAAGIGEWLDTRQSTIPDITDQLTTTQIATAMEQASLGSVPAASISVVGKSRFGTNAEVAAGTLSTVGITPAGLESRVGTTTMRGILRTATAGDITTGTATDAAVTPLNLGPIVNSFVAAGGYSRLPGGLIVQWGTFTFTGATGTVTLPLAFPTACMGAVISGSSTAQTVGVSSVSATQLSVVSNQNLISRWIAVGY